MADDTYGTRPAPGACCPEMRFYEGICQGCGQNIAAYHLRLRADNDRLRTELDAMTKKRNRLSGQRDDWKKAAEAAAYLLKVRPKRIAYLERAIDARDGIQRDLSAGGEDCIYCGRPYCEAKCPTKAWPKGGRP